ncbi:hypothetical protein TrispH2_005262 [Trichoplax sp. H2]|nr:hypothetical protein TrispH2_005262 [Trichoplax sp. H2]|eukprot:RDD42877.1 hypothetical protein TrispH2_005262 [Trichoplax sp. H2]
MAISDATLLIEAVARELLQMQASKRRYFITYWTTIKLAFSGVTILTSIIIIANKEGASIGSSSLALIGAFMSALTTLACFLLTYSNRVLKYFANHVNLCRLCLAIGELPLIVAFGFQIYQVITQSDSMKVQSATIANLITTGLIFISAFRVNYLMKSYGKLLVSLEHSRRNAITESTTDTTITNTVRENSEIPPEYGQHDPERNSEYPTGTNQESESTVNVILNPFQESLLSNESINKVQDTSAIQSSSSSSSILDENILPAIRPQYHQFKTSESNLECFINSNHNSEPTINPIVSMIESFSTRMISSWRSYYQLTYDT